MNALVPSAQKALVLLDRIGAEIASAQKFEAIWFLALKAKAIQVAMAEFKEVADKAGRVRVAAVARIGGKLAALPKAKGAAAGGKKDGPRGNFVEPRDTTPTLSEIGVSKRLSSIAQRLAAIPEAEHEKICESLSKADKPISPNAVVRTAEKDANARKRRAKIAAGSAAIPAIGDRYELRRAACIEAISLEAESVDLIVTDPPYPEEYLPVFDDLGQVAARVLKPGGLAIVMVGQSYVPEIHAALGRHLAYHWEVSYLTPGGQAVQVFPRKVNTFWKPVLIYRKGDYAGDWFGDVARSDVNDNDKEHHHWGQSASGMRDLMRRFVHPGHVVLDPFLGGGTTAVVALELGARFIGFDIDEDALLTTRARIGEIHAMVV